MTLAFLCAPDAGDDPPPRAGRFSSEPADVGGPAAPLLHEQALVARVRAGDDEALEGIFRQHYGELLRFAGTLMHGRDGVDDVVHDVFMAIVHRRDRWMVTSSLRAYLFRAVRNRVLSVQRNAAREQGRIARVARTDDDVLRIGAEPPSVMTDPVVQEEARTQAALADAVERALAELPPPLRQIVALRWEHGLAYDEIADILGTSAVGARKQASRALAQLRTAVRTLIG